MATLVCPECGSQYVASVRRCIDCDAMLVDDVGPAGEAAPSVATPLGEGDQIAYELEGWGNQLRVTLSGMLDLNGIAHVWEVGALVVAAPHEEKVDELIAAVEGGEGEELDADVPQVAFEIEEVSADELAALDAELIAAHIPHAWQETGELLVPEESEEEVAELIEAILNPSEDETEDDGLATHAALDALYVAVDKLGKDPADEKLIARYAAAADGLDGLRVPYGMSGKEWEDLVAQVEVLRTVLAKAGEADGDGDGGDAEAERPEPTVHAVDGQGGGDEGEGGEGEGDDGNAARDANGGLVVGSSDADKADQGDDRPLDGIERARELVGQLRTRMLDLV
ncbi:MAG TPA: hypothetical protein VNQ33_06595 [Acidimicrobiales bacterium]|nr:hypothetical protein [Acidimicrobiales bacterium]